MVALNLDVPAEATGPVYGPMPAGDYVGDIVEITFPISSAGYEQLCIQVRIDGRGSIWDYLNYKHPTQASKDIAMRKLQDIGRALGMSHIADTDQLLARRVGVYVGFKKDDPKKNEIKSYSAPDDTPAPVQNQVAAAGTPPVAPAAPVASPAVAEPVPAPAWRAG